MAKAKKEVQEGALEKKLWKRISSYQILIIALLWKKIIKITAKATIEIKIR